MYISTRIPYGTDYLPLEEEFTSAQLLIPHLVQQEKTGEALVSEAMENPYGPSLRELAAGKKNAVILISDHTRPVPSRLILPPMLAQLRQASPGIQITLLVATGCHRGTTEQELREKLGEDILQREHIVVHDCDDAENMVCLGALPSGVELWINRLAAETELLLAEGFIEPHFFAGFSGGRKSVLPGVCARRTVMANHCAAFIDHPAARTGILEGNPIHADMAAAAKMARLAYIVNVLLSPQKQVIQAVAGDPVLAHRAGCRAMAALAGVSPERRGDIVITSNGGAPLDQNVYQMVKSAATAEAAAASGGTIIVCGSCTDGIGGEQFYRAMAESRSPEALLSQIRRVAPEETVPDQWQYQILCRILKSHRVILVTDPALKEAVADMKLTYCRTLPEAIAMAKAFHPGGHAVILPDGVSTIVR